VTTPTPILNAGRAHLRPFEPTDAETYRRWRADARTAVPAGWPQGAPLSLAQVEQRIARLTKEQGTEVFTFVICIPPDGRPIGEVLLADIDRVNGSAELGIFIGEVGEWGKGYGTDALNAIVDFAFGELRLERVWLNVSTDNPRARRAYDKVGFVEEATVRHDRFEGGRHTTGVVMSILRGEWEARRGPRD
jgi:RimJ/RimL family protein N-acetyltransferase